MIMKIKMILWILIEKYNKIIKIIIIIIINLFLEEVVYRAIIIIIVIKIQKIINTINK